MHEIVTTPRGPNPIETFRGAPPAPLPKWRQLKSRRKREMERFGDLQRHPWRGERQAQMGYSTTYMSSAVAVDRELRAVPYFDRLHNPPGGAFPVVQGLEVGTGPSPWLAAAPAELVVPGARGRRDPEGPAHPLTNVPIERNDANYYVGPHAPARNELVPLRATKQDSGIKRWSKATAVLTAAAAGGAKGAIMGGGPGTVVGAVGGALGSMVAGGLAQAVVG